VQLPVVGVGVADGAEFDLRGGGGGRVAVDSEGGGVGVGVAGGGGGEVEAVEGGCGSEGGG
jgi:hypothetical protein